MTIALIATAIWIAMLLLVAALCMAARRGDGEGSRNAPVRTAEPGPARAGSEAPRAIAA